MANEEHLTKLKQGVKEWNSWREWMKQRVIQVSDPRKVDLRRADLRGVDLCRADLSGANLSGANLSRANLNEADLREADLREADLREADLTEAKLGKANLSGAGLSWAYLGGANLSEANLTKANLTEARLTWSRGLPYSARQRFAGTDFTEANLAEADLTRAQFGKTILSSTNLTGTSALDTCRHLGPSTLDHRTLAKSGNLPKVFLQGCGLPDWLIEAYKLTHEGLSRNEITDIVYQIDHLRAEQPLQFYSCFISYSSKNDPFARRLHDDLQENGVRCWFAPEDLKIGDRIRPAIHDAIRLHDKLLIILSEHSTESHWVEDEVERALEKERRDKSTVLFPIRLDDTVFNIDRGWAVSIRNTRHIGDFCSWDNEDNYSQAFDRLLRDLRAS